MSADECDTKEFEMVRESLAATNAEIKPIIEADDPQVSTSKIRRWTLKLNKQIELLSKFKPQKGKPDIHNFADSALQVLMQARLYLAELPGLIATEHEERADTKQDHITFIPRNLEIQVPIFDGNYKKYPAFIEAFNVATESSSMSTKHKFIAF